EKKTGLDAEVISYEPIIKGKAPPEFKQRSGASYKPSHNEDPAIPVQCWIETGYGTQNACKYCHTDYLADLGHGNSFPLAEDQILYSFPSPNLNRVNWSNIIYPQEITQRLKKEEMSIPRSGDPELPQYVRTDNWQGVYSKARGNGDDTWNNVSHSSSDFQLFPALNPENLYPYSKKDPTHGGEHGFIDLEGFVRDAQNQYTGWRAINFFPYAIFTPLTGSVSGIYIRLPDRFMTQDGEMDIEIYKKNLSLLEKNIKNLSLDSPHYFGDAEKIKVKKGFYPVGTEFAHPLHYVDLNADGEMGEELNGVKGPDFDYEFPGTRSKRVKEIRYMYKWKDVGLDDIGEEEKEEEVPHVIGKEGKGWIDNEAGWILAAYIENRKGNLRPQTTEELLQCKGCHSSVGNTVDAVWSFERKLPGDLGWGEMDYGKYQEENQEKTRLHDYFKKNVDMGELEYFYATVVGADLFGVMPSEIKSEVMDYAEERNLVSKMSLKNSLSIIFNDEKLKSTPEKERKRILEERARIMRHYATQRAYLYHDEETGSDYIKGAIFYPSLETMLSNIAGYKRIVLDQSFNLGKNVFGTQPEAVPFTFRSDGTVLDAKGEIIPVGEVIESRPWGEDGVGITPTGIVKVNSAGEPVDEEGNVVDIQKNPQKVVGHVSKGGTFETRYNPIITGNPVKKKQEVKKERKKKN
ncbi:hypothetical protein KGY73_08175, partial [bacterium]|nr:hypothetical protein [bacterium]